jgi:predicted  nucleic acid-binding Zn-ribbon protein
VSSSNQIEQLQAEADYYRDRVALLRAKLYRWGVGSNARLERLERELQRAEQRLRDERLRAKP